MQQSIVLFELIALGTQRCVSPAVGKPRVAKRSGSTVAVFTDLIRSRMADETAVAGYVSEEHSATKYTTACKLQQFKRDQWPVGHSWK